MSIFENTGVDKLQTKHRMSHTVEECPHCGHTEHYESKTTPYECKRCHRKASNEEWKWTVLGY